MVSRAVLTAPGVGATGWPMRSPSRWSARETARASRSSVTPASAAVKEESRAKRPSPQMMLAGRGMRAGRSCPASGVTARASSSASGRRDTEVLVGGNRPEGTVRPGSGASPPLRAIDGGRSPAASLGIARRRSHTVSRSSRSGLRCTPIRSAAPGTASRTSGCCWPGRRPGAPATSSPVSPRRPPPSGWRRRWRWPTCRSRRCSARR